MSRFAFQIRRWRSAPLPFARISEIRSSSRSQPSSRACGSICRSVRRTLTELEPHARELGCEDELEGISEILRNGNGADRQRRVWHAKRDIAEVVRAIADATEPAAVPA